MPNPKEVAEIVVNGKRYRDWQSVSVTRSGLDLFPKFSFKSASPIESAPNWAGLKLAMGDKCQVYLAGRQVVDGAIRHRNPAYDAQQHGLVIAGSSRSAAIGRAAVDHTKGEFKNYGLSQIANSVLAPYGVKFSLKGETSGADKPFERVNVQAGETVFALIERLCRMRNVYLLPGTGTDIVGYRLGQGTKAVADLQEGRNIKVASAVFSYEGAFSEHTAIGQRPGTDDHFGDDARDVSATVKNTAVTEHAPNVFMAEMPGDQSDMRMRAQHENGTQIGTQVSVTVVVQGWHKDDGSLWLEHIGDPLSVYSPMLFTDDRLNLAVQEATSTQDDAGTLTTLNLVLPAAFNGMTTIQGSAAGIPGVGGA